METLLLYFSKKANALFTTPILILLFIAFLSSESFANTITSVAVSAPTGSVTYGTGGIVTYTITVTPDGSPGALPNRALSLFGTLPSGVTAVFSPTTLSFASNSPTPQIATLTITSVNTSPAAISNLTISCNSVSSSSFAYTVNQKSLTITATSASKCFGTTYVLGTTAFTSSGLVPGDNIGSVTLTSAGAAAGAAAGSYPIVPSAPSGTPFLASNYNITYVNGNLIVTPTNTVGTASSILSACSNTALTPTVTHATTGATGITNDGISGASGLPAGVSAHWESGEITVSGTPTVSGIFNYSFLLTGGCGSVSATGTLTVTPSSDNMTTIAACDSYTWAANGITYTTSGVYTGPTVGCVTEKLDLTINNSTSSTMTETACDSYTWAANGTTYTASGTYTNVTTNAAGCPDSATLVLTINNSTSGTTTETACDSYTWAAPLGNGLTYTTSQSGVTFVSTNAAGCSHTETLELTINNSSSGTTTATACDSYTWAAPLGNGQTYTTSQSGVTFVSTNAAGCSHTETLELTINNSTTGTTTATACDTYTWAAPLGNGQTYTTSQSGVTFVSTNAAGCSHIETLELTITPSSDNVTTMAACDFYTWPVNGTTYFVSGIYTGTTTNCVTEKLDLTITTIDNTVTVGTGVLTSNASSGTYQWIDCNTNLPVPGETNQSFTPAVSGTYKVVVISGSCSATSACQSIVSLKVAGFDSKAFSFYPNPVRDNLNLNYSKEITSVKVMNVMGQVVLQKSINATTTQIEMSSIPAGTYFVEVKSLNDFKIIKVIKN